MRVRLVLVQEARIVLLRVVVVRVGVTATTWLLTHFLMNLIFNYNNYILLILLISLIKLIIEKQI